MSTKFDDSNDDPSVYKNNYQVQGKALIFNQEKFEDGKGERIGSKNDVKILTKTFGDLGFEVTSYINERADDIDSILQNVAEKDHTNSNCLCIILMSHGNENHLYAYDRFIEINKLYKKFSNQNCPSLIGKPKFFFIQACRGQEYERQIKLIRKKEALSINTEYVQPDFLKVFGTFSGNVSFRNSQYGSWFITELCKELNQNGRTLDIMKMLTNVTRNVGLYYSANETNRQSVTRQSTLLKQFFFSQKL